MGTSAMHDGAAVAREQTSRTRGFCARWRPIWTCNLACSSAWAFCLLLVLAPLLFFQIKRGKAQGHTWFTWWKPQGHSDIGPDMGRRRLLPAAWTRGAAHVTDEAVSPRQWQRRPCQNSVLLLRGRDSRVSAQSQGCTTYNYSACACQKRRRHLHRLRSRAFSPIATQPLGCRSIVSGLDQREGGRP